MGCNFVCIFRNCPDEFPIDLPFFFNSPRLEIAKMQTFSDVCCLFEKVKK